MASENTGIMGHTGAYWMSTESCYLIVGVRGSGRGWVRPSPSNSDDSLERCSMITRPEPEDFWDI